MFGSLIIKIRIFSKKTRLIAIRTLFWIVTVHDGLKTNPANAYCLLGTIDFSNIVDIDNLLVEKKNSAILIINE